MGVEQIPKWISILRNSKTAGKVLRKGVETIKNIKATPDKTSAKDLIKTNEKSLQRVIDKGSYDPNEPSTKSFLHKYRKQTTKKILKQNKPE